MSPVLHQAVRHLPSICRLIYRLLHLSATKNCSKKFGMHKQDAGVFDRF